VWLSGVLNSLLACAQPLQDWAAMKEVATDLIALEPNDCDAWIRLSIGLKHLGELTPATEAVLRAIELDADDSNARYEHACQLAVAGDLEAALDRVAEALDRGARRAEMQADDELSALHGLPRWQTLMRTRH
jgi:thioredoxin-like negative regulator of GroEL